MDKDKKLSPPLQLLTIVWKATDDGTRCSWERLNSSMQRALSLAIESRMKFDLDDFDYVNKNLRPWYWMDNDGHMFGEGYYAKAIHSGNLSATMAFEAWKNRTPFTTDNVTTTRWGGNPKTLLRSRLAIHFSFYWNGETVTVTSFSEDGTYLTACSYKNNKPDEYRRKIKCRYKITVKDLRNLRKEMKKLVEAVSAIEGAERSVADTTKMLTRNNLTIKEAWEKIDERRNEKTD